MSGLLSVKDAVSRILDGVEPVTREHVDLHDAGGRVLAVDIAATRTQPPFPASAMDGYAVRAQDVAHTPCILTLIGESAAGHAYTGSVGANECVRIFTGAPVPKGADTIIIQENVTANQTSITVLQSEKPGRYIRPAGMDFAEGEVLLEAGLVLNPSTVSLAAAMNHPKLPVFKKPNVAIIATGDELRLPGEQPAADQIIASNSFGVAEIVRRAGGEPIDLGIAADSFEALETKFEAAQGADIVVTLGGASVGDHDLVSGALKQNNVSLDFWKLAMRPGKPVMFGKTDTSGQMQRFIGLPGNPVSSLVCALIFIEPLIRKMTGRNPNQQRLTAVLGASLAQNDQREEYMRATLSTINGERCATPFAVQDSSVISLMAKADCLIIRPAFGPEMAIGDPCEIILL